MARTVAYVTFLEALSYSTGRKGIGTHIDSYFLHFRMPLSNVLQKTCWRYQTSIWIRF